MSSTLTAPAAHGTRPPKPQARLPLFRTPEWAWRQVGCVGWWVQEGWQDVLLGPSGLRLDEWQSQNRLTTIKTGPHRVVYRVDLPGTSVYIKHYKVPTWRETLRQWFRRGKGRNEAKRAIRLARLGVSTITPIALGEQRKRKFLFENYLISPEIPHSYPLDEFVERTLPALPAPELARLRRALASEVARLTARLHAAGFLHQDFHPGNILVRMHPSGHVELSMIDLDALRRRRRISTRAIQANLALLNHYFWSRCNRSDRALFLKSYLDARPDLQVDAHAFARAIERSTRAWAERLWRRWGRRCRGTNKYFKTFRGQARWAVASRRLNRDSVRQIMTNPDALFKHPAARLIKHSRTTTVAELPMLVGDELRSVIVKRFNAKKRLDPLLALLRPTRGWRAWQAGQHLASRGIPTPDNLLYVRTPIGNRLPGPLRRLPGNTYLVTLKAEPATTLSDFARDVLPQLNENSRRSVVAAYTRALARLLRTLHERSLAHRDLKAANILITGDPLAPEPTLSLIDLVGVQLQHPLPRRKRVQNLARVLLSLEFATGRTRAETLRFLRHYLPWCHTPRTVWKQLWRDIDRAARAKRVQNQRRGRALS